jgi:hypothetical protein
VGDSDGYIIGFSEALAQSGRTGSRWMKHMRSFAVPTVVVSWLFFIVADLAAEVPLLGMVSTRTLLTSARNY